MKIQLFMRSLIGIVLLGSAGLGAQELGNITFPTSGSAAAQPKFIEGVKDLHSFAFDEAREAFQKAQQIDPNFAMAYWGEAMSYNHPLWAQIDVPAAKKTLERLAPTAEGRVAKAHTPKEKGYLEAVNLLFYGPDNKLLRDEAYSQAMGRMYDKWRDDHEVAILYALSLLGTVRPGDQGFRRQALAASIAEKVFQENPNHPGAAHFIIHAFDDPDHAILALPAARVYAKIAPDAPHALHMPSHIFLQLGMWQDVRSSNIAAHRAAVAVNTRMHLPEGREDFHTLSWLEYANLMLGNFDEAQQNLELAKEAADRNPKSNGVVQQYHTMWARYILETAKWEKIPLKAATTGEDPESAADMVMAPMQSRSPGWGPWIFITGLSAAKLGDVAEAEQAAKQLGVMEERVAKADPYPAKMVAIMRKEVSASVQMAQGDKSAALQTAKEAADIESNFIAPSGPPEPLKPAIEFYGELLLANGRPADAAAAFRKQLLRTPNRTPSVKGLARAITNKASDSLSAAR